MVKKLVRLLLLLPLLSLFAPAQANYNFDVGGLGFSSGPSVPASCPQDGYKFWLNTGSVGWYTCKTGTWTVDGSGAGGGTVTNIATSTGLTGGPITTSGTLSILLAYQLPQGCANTNTATWNSAGSNWVCSAAGTGTVTVVSAGTLTNTALATGGGTQTIQTPSATSTLSSGGNLSLPGTATATQFVSTVLVGTPPLSVTSTTNVPNLNASSLNGATFAAPGAIGGTTPGAGTFSALTDTAMSGGPFCVHETSGLLSATAADCGSGTGGGISGATVANEIVALTATTATSSPARVYLSQITGANNNDYCDKVNSAFLTRPNGAIVVGDLQGNQHCTALTAANMFANCNNGYLQMQDTNLYIDFQNQIPPLIQIGNKCGGIRGIGRGDKGSFGSNINACTGTGVGHANCLAPVSRVLTINSMTAGATYTDINYTVVTGPAPLAGELAQVTAEGVLSLTSWTLTSAGTLLTAQAANAGTSALTVGQKLVLNNITHGGVSSNNAYLTGLTVTVASRSTTQFTATVVAPGGNDSGTETSALASPVNNNMFRIVATAGSGQAVTNDPSGTNPTATDFNVVCPNCTTTGAIGTVYLGTALVGIFTTGLNSAAITRTLTSVNTTGVYQCSTCGSDVVGEWVGYNFAMSGFTNGGNNISGVVIASNTTSISLGNVTTVTETHAGTATLPKGNFSFAERIENVSINCGEGGASVVTGLRGCIPLQNINGEEQAGWSDTVATGSTFADWDLHGNFFQNSGPYSANEAYVGGDTCEEGTIAAFFADSTIAPVNKQTFTASSCGSNATPPGSSPEPNVGWLVDNQNTTFSATHPEGYWIGYEVGQDIGSQSDVFITNGGQPSAHPGNTAIDISANFCSAANNTSDITIVGQKQNLGATNIIHDGCRNTTITDSYVGLYSWDKNGSLLNFLATSTHQPNELDSGLILGQSGVLSFVANGGTAVNLSSPSTNLLNLGTNSSITNAGVLNVGVGFQIAGAAVNGNLLEGNGTNFVSIPPGIIPNAQTGTTYTYTGLVGSANDRASYTTFSNASPIAVTLPQAGTGNFTNNWVNVSCNIGAGTVTITPTTSTISYTNGSAYTSAASSLALTTGQCAWIYSDNTNYFAIVRAAAASAQRLDQILASNANTSIANGNNTETWTSAQTTDAQDAFALNEASAATNGTLTNSLANQSEFHVGTASGSTAAPVEIEQLGVTATTGPPALQIESTWNNASLVGHLIFGNVTNTSSAAASDLLNLQVGNAAQAIISKTGFMTLGAATAVTSGTGGGIGPTEGTGCTGVASVDCVYADSTQHAIEVNNNNTGAMPVSRTACINLTPVTVAANVTTDQLLQACSFNANLLNVVGRTLKVYVAGNFSTAAASVAALTFKAKLCTVSGCGSGTVIVPVSTTTGATSALTAANLSFSQTSYISTQTAGATSAYEAHGYLTIDLSATAATPDSIYQDTNTATVGTIDSTGALFLQITAAASAASTSNSFTERQLVVEVVN